MSSAVAGKRILILGGTLISCEIVKTAREMGLFVGVADYNPVEKSPAKKIADKAYLVNALDVDAVVDLIRTEKYDGVLCGFADVLLPAYADICKKAGLPAYGTREQFELYTDKEQYKQLCRKYYVPCVQEYEIDPEHIEKTAAAVSYPIMVKPADSSGARGITICNNAGELIAAIRKAESFSAAKKVIVEQYLTGKEVTVFWLFKDGEYYMTCIGNRHVKKNQEGVIPLPVGYTYPAQITEKYIHDIVPKAKDMFKGSGIKNGMMFMQCKVEGEECIVYDIGYRLTGSLEYGMLEELCGYNPMKMMIAYAVTGSMGEPELEKKVDPFFHGEYGYNVSILGKPGKIEHINGVDEVKKQVGVLDAVLAHLPGETITQEMKGLLSQIVVRILGTAPDKAALKKRMSQVYDTIQDL